MILKNSKADIIERSGRVPDEKEMILKIYFQNATMSQDMIIGTSKERIIRNKSLLNKVLLKLLFTVGCLNVQV